MRDQGDAPVAAHVAMRESPSSSAPGPTQRHRSAPRKDTVSSLGFKSVRGTLSLPSGSKLWCVPLDLAWTRFLADAPSNSRPLGTYLPVGTSQATLTYPYSVRWVRSREEGEVCPEVPMQRSSKVLKLRSRSRAVPGEDERLAAFEKHPMTTQ